MNQVKVFILVTLFLFSLSCSNVKDQNSVIKEKSLDLQVLEAYNEGKKSLESGCNLILYCGGNINDSSILLKGTNKIDKFTIKKTQQFYRFLR